MLDSGTAPWYNRAMKSGALSVGSGQEMNYTEGLETEVVNLRSRMARMEQDMAAMQQTIAELTQQVEEKDARIHQQNGQLQDAAYLNKNLLTIISFMYGTKSEKHKNVVPHIGQMAFDLSEYNLGSAQVQPEEYPALTQNPAAPPRKPARPRRKKKSLGDLMNLLPVKETIRPEMPTPDCEICGEQMEEIGTTTYKELCVEPAKLYVREYEMPVFGCKNCDRNGTTVPIIRPEMPLARPLPRCVASAETLAWVVYQKLAMFTPLYRLERMFAQMGVEISRMTMCNWMIGACLEWLASLAERIQAELVSQAIIHADETPFQVLEEPGRRPQSKGYAWIFCSTYEGAEERFIVFMYSASRGHEVPMECLAGFQGYMMVDAFAAYDKMAQKVEGIFLCRCWAHCRREWVKAIKTMQPEPDSPLAIGYAYIEKFFMMERELEGHSLEERFLMRLQYEKPLLDEFHAWLLKQYQGETAFAKAVKYTLNHWDDLYQVLADGRLPATNAAAELMAKSIALIRKNALFAKSVDGANAVMTGLSVVETAKANDLKPYEYLLWIFRQMPRDWKVMLQILADTALKQAKELADREFRELVPLIDQSVRKPPAPGQSREQWIAAARELVREKIVDPVYAEVEGMLVSEGRFVLSGFYLPRHAPPQCKKSNKPREEGPKEAEESSKEALETA